MHSRQIRYMVTWIETRLCQVITWFRNTDNGMKYGLQHEEEKRYRGKWEKQRLEQIAIKMK